MKNKLFWVLALTFVLICALAISASAYTVSYDGQSYTQTTNENGEVTLRNAIFGSTDQAKTFFGWFTLEGDVYEPGQTITIDKDIKLYQAYGYKATNNDILNVMQGTSSWDWPYVQLQEDIVLEASMAPPWGGCATIDLNGYTITTSAQDAISQQRGGIRFVGSGEIIHKGTGNFFKAWSHGYGDGSQYLLIGKNVKVTTGGILLYYTNNVNSNIPVMIYGDVICKQIAHINSFGEGKVVTFTINPVRLYLKGDKLITCDTYPPVDQMVVNITGGALKLPTTANESAYWNNDKASSYTIAITGGTFNTGVEAASAYIPQNYEKIEQTINGTTYTIVQEQTNCAHNYTQISTSSANCIVYAKINYKCSKCNDQISVAYGERSDHIWNVVNEIPATTTSTGLRIYDCQTCDNKKEVIFYYDPSDLLINVGTVYGVVQAKVSDVLRLVASEDEYAGTSYTVAGVMAFDDYEVADIISIEIPVGIANANFILTNNYIEKITILDNADIRITKFTNLKALTTIEIGAANVFFAKGCANDAITSIKSDTPGANVIFEANVFEGEKQLTELTICAGSEYEFGSCSFKQAGVKQFIIPDGCSPVFKSEGAFYESALEYIYIGTGNKHLSGKPFDRCGSLKTLVIMDVESFSHEWNFCVPNEVETLLEVYIHSEKISFTNNTFYCRSGITVYTAAEITNASAFASCSNYTIVYGIPHKLQFGEVDPTCTKPGAVGYITDCPCEQHLIGEVEVKIFNSCLTNAETYQCQTYASYELPALGHDEGEIYNVVYALGFDHKGTKTAFCLRCENTYTEQEPSANEIYVFLGYSTNKNFTEIAVGYLFDVYAMEVYEKATNSTFEYGVVGAITLALGDKAPHEVTSSAVNFAAFERGTSYVVYKIQGFSEKLYDLGITMCAYAKVNDENGMQIYYIQDSQTQSPSSYTLGELIESLTPNDI